ncbi:hypothetical protein K3495_g1616 [Podosphaera aphanis]|nr:hypothetical protein K3495_g1616 [Podosphaera aphanis]
MKMSISSSLGIFYFISFFLLALVNSSPNPKYKPGAVVNGLGLPISNINAASDDMIPNRYVVVYSQNATAEEVKGHRMAVETAIKKRSLNARALDGRHLSPMMHNIDLPGWNAMCLDAEDAMIIDIESAPEVAYIEADTIISTTELKKQEDAPPGLSRLSHATETNEDEFIFDDTASGAGVTVYVVDTGIRTSHVEFGGRATMGANFVNDVNTDENGHGSHVAATIGGASFGVAKNTQLVGVKVLDAKGSGSNAVVLRGMNFVAEDVAKKGLKGKAVVNISLGGVKSKALNGAIDALTSAGVTVVVAAGNDNKDSEGFSPASAGSAITVGAIDPLTDKKALFSNFGAKMDINAPGVKILSAGIANDTATKVLSGTSMASPHVAGLAAYLISTEDIESPEAVISRMLELATSTGSAAVGVPDGTTTLIAYNGSGR